MRLLIAAAVCLVALYAIDAHWFGGAYFVTVRSIAAQMAHHL